MALKQMVDALEAGKKVGLRDFGYVYISIGNTLRVEALDDGVWCDYNSDELIGMIFRRHKECVIFPEEGP